MPRVFSDVAVRSQLIKAYVGKGCLGVCSIFVKLCGERNIYRHLSVEAGVSVRLPVCLSHTHAHTHALTQEETAPRQVTVTTFPG